MAKYIIIYVLSLFDLGCTLYLTSRFGVDVETNPFGRFLLTRDWAAVIYKVIVVGGALGVLYRFRDNAVARYASWLVLGVYAAIAIYEICIIGRVHWIMFMR